MKAIGSTTIGIGTFVQVPVQVFKPGRRETLREKLHTICSCGERPKQSIDCPGCGASFSSWFAIPDRVFDAGNNMTVVLSKAELDTARSDNKEMMVVEKVVDLRQFAAEHVLSDPMLLMPGDKAVSAIWKTYRLLVEALASDGRTMLARMTLRNVTRRYALIPDDVRGLLFAYEVADAHPIDRDVPAIMKADTKALSEARTLLEGLASSDMSFPADPDPLEPIISAKIDEMMTENAEVGKQRTEESAQ